MELVTRLADKFMDYGDPRMKRLPLMGSPYPLLCIVLVYLLCVFLGPRIMRHRDPINIKTMLLIYNPAMAVLSFIICFCTLYKFATHKKRSFVCLEVDRGDSQYEMEIVYLAWLTFISRFVELADTIFFILRKKNSQITFLHVYHHTTVLVLCWVLSLFIPGGQVWFVIAINGFIHVIMYTYYTLAALGPHMQKYLWWKKYLTSLQLIQFVLLIIHCTVNELSDCAFPKLYNEVVVPYYFSLFLLFMNFYRKAYDAGKKAK